MSERERDADRLTIVARWLYGRDSMWSGRPTYESLPLELQARYLERAEDWLGDHRNLLAALASPETQGAQESEVEVWCTSADGSLKFHPESEPCERCAPVESEGLELNELSDPVANRMRANVFRAAAPVAEPRELHGWQVERAVTCVVCPSCAFTFDATHEDEGGGYSCPSCAPVAGGAQPERMIPESEWMHGTEIICDRCSTGWSGPIAGEKVKFQTCPDCLRAEIAELRAAPPHAEGERAGLTFVAANGIREDSWLHEKRFSWFLRGYRYAALQTRAIPALAAVEPEDLYFAVWAVMRGAGITDPEERALAATPSEGAPDEA